MKSITPGKFVGHITPCVGGYEVHYAGKSGTRTYKKWFITRIEAVAFLNDAPPPTTHALIRYFMKDNEKSLLIHVRSLNESGAGYRPSLPSQAWRNAIERLTKKGKLVYRPTRNISDYTKSGYWIKTKKRTK
jgi:hypothetical protein